jgi:hypothetical protein
MNKLDSEYRVNLIIKNTKINRDKLNVFLRWFDQSSDQFNNNLIYLSEFEIIRKLESIKHEGNIFCQKFDSNPSFLLQYQTKI